jgi:hypothetical protein
MGQGALRGGRAGRRLRRVAVAGAVAVVMAGMLAGPTPAGALQFAKTATYSLGRAVSSRSGVLRSGDFNGDGILDLVVAQQSIALGVDGAPAQLSGDVKILLGRGDGTFAPGSVTSVPGGAAAVVVGDFNGDHRLDLAVSEGSAGVAVLLGRGDGSFDPPGPAVGGYPSGVVGDFNGDGLADVLYAAWYPSYGEQLLLGTAGGPPGPGSSFAGGSSLDCPAAADMNRDGRLDVICADALNGWAISVFPGRGDGTFGPPIAEPSGLASNANFVDFAVGDVNGDGLPDVVEAGSAGSADHVSTQQVAVLLGRGDGTLGPPVAIALPDRESFVDGPPVLADFDGDGKPDILIAGWPASVLLGNGDGSFQPPVDLGVYNSLVGAPADAGSNVVADFNGDGKPDIATLDPHDSQQQDPDLDIYINGQTTPLQVTPTSAALGDQAIGGGTWTTFAPYGLDTAVHMYSGARQLITVANPGDGPVGVGPASITGVDPADFVIFDDSCAGRTLAPGQACSVYIAFVPTAEGTRSAAVVIGDAAPGSPNVIPLAGRGLPPAPPAPAASPPAPTAAGPPAAATCTLGAAARILGTRITVPVTCDGPARAAVTGTLLPAADARAATATKRPPPVRVAAHRAVAVAIHLDAGDRRRLTGAHARHRKLRIRLSLVVYDASGPHAAVTRIVAA